jgi:hypothetical protein
MLSARPVRNEAAKPLREGTSRLRLTVKRRKLRYLVPPLSWVIRPRPTHDVVLDELGAEVWDLCDGERTVEAVADEFARRHSLSFHESRVAVTSYMAELVRRGALAMVI